jgi:outer membrane protein assembly factor BamB
MLRDFHHSGGVMSAERAFLLSCSVLALALVACGGGDTSSSGSMPSATAPTISTQPIDQSVVVGQSASFGVSASGTAPLTYQWERDGTAIAGATSSSYTTAATTSADDGALFEVIISNAAGSITSSQAKLTVAPAPLAGTDVTTYKFDLARTGLNPSESALTPVNVNSMSFGLLRILSVDGKVDAQPLYLSHLTIAGTTHNVVYVATEHDSVYAFDADTGTMLWHVTLLGSGETLSDTRSCGQVTPEIGITSTPVIDRHAGANGALYVVAMSKSGASTYYQRLHALDVTTGAELSGGPTTVVATYPTANGGTTTFDPAQYEERAALLLVNGIIYTSWTSHCDNQPYTGWVIAFSESSLQRTAVLNLAPNSGGAGPSIWMSGGGPAADSSGSIYLLTANGVFETSFDANGFPDMQDYGNSFVRIAAANNALSVADYFTMSNEIAESAADEDLGSGGEMLLPDLTDSTGTVRHLVVGAGKDGNIYVVNRDSMGHFNTPNNIWQELDGALRGGVWATPAYFNSTVYYGDVGGTLKALAIASAKLASAASSQSATAFTYPGTAPAVSASGSSNGIVWAHENTAAAVLHAYDATNLAKELYNSNQAANGRDQFGTGNKFITPAIADGKVFVGTTSGVAVFGLLH